MKKMIGVLVVASLVFMVSFSYACGGGNCAGCNVKEAAEACSHGANFVDADKDGVCDSASAAGNMGGCPLSSQAPTAGCPFSKGQAETK